MPVPTKPNEQRLRRDNDFTWDQFAKDCLLNKYVLVVGNEAMLNRNVNPEAEGDSLKLLLELTIHELVQLNAIPDNRLDGCKSFNDLFKLNYSKDAIKEAVLNAIRGNDFYPQFDAEIEPSLMQLLETRCFRVVITTAIDPYLEIAMEKVWGSGGFDVIQIENAQQSFRQVTFDEFGVSRPLLCYVFGKADANSPNSRFVLSENDAMEKISTWFKKYDTNKFLDYVKNFQLLSVGTKFDDWMFRFFWYLLRGEFGNASGGQQVAVEIKNGDNNLANYLKQEKVKVFPDARQFMREAIGKINAATDINLLPRKDNGVFISYAHEDRYIALPLFERLHAAGINVWLDEDKLEGGAEYEQRIRSAIKNCKVFMPILSSQVKDDLTRQPQRWYQKEWQWAQSRRNEEAAVSGDGHARFKVIPVVVGDYRYSESYHQQLPKCLIAATAFETAKDNIEHLVRLINA